jgi:hypothetical protein
VSQTFDQSVLIEWTAPGDDGLAGRPAGYELRWSLSAIDAGNFAAATPVEPSPLVREGGAEQLYLVTGLMAATRYYFALVAVDEAGNRTALSNVVTTVTQAVDEVPPNTVSDVELGP